MRSSNNPLNKDEIDDEDQKYTSGHEDISCDGDSNVVRPCCPDYSKDRGGYSGHAETE